MVRSIGTSRSAHGWSERDGTEPEAQARVVVPTAQGTGNPRLRFGLGTCGFGSLAYFAGLEQATPKDRTAIAYTTA